MAQKQVIASSIEKEKRVYLQSGKPAPAGIREVIKGPRHGSHNICKKTPNEILVLERQADREGAKAFTWACRKKRKPSRQPSMPAKEEIIDSGRETVVGGWIGIQKRFFCAK